MKDNFHVKFTWFISMLISVKFYWNSQHRICTSECNLFTRASVQSVFDCWFPCAFFENWISIDEAQPEAITLILPSSTKYFFPSSFSLFFFRISFEKTLQCTRFFLIKWCFMPLFALTFVCLHFQFSWNVEVWKTGSDEIPNSHQPGAFIDCNFLKPKKAFL